MVATRPPLFQLPTVKVCRLCGQTKPLSEFAGRTRSPDGHQAHCKVCGRKALDAADAKRKAARAAASPARPGPRVQDWDDLEAVLAAEAETVAEVLDAAVDAGDPAVLDRLADALCPDCPADADEDYDGPDCLLHDLAAIHSGRLFDRFPVLEDALYGDDSGGASGA